MQEVPIMEFKELIARRRSVRGYAGGIPREALETILRQAQQAPSWKNAQASRCYVVQSPEKLAEVRAALPDFNQNSSAGAALIVTTYVEDVVGFTRGVPDNEVGNGWGAYDLGLRDAYLVLAAADAGYDTLIMGLRDAEAIRRALGVPENERILSVIAVGRRSVEPKTKPRKDLSEVAKFF